MAITPDVLEQNEMSDVLSVPVIQPSLTYRLEGGRIIGKVDGIEAVKQFIQKAIETARNRYLIYDDQYGSELEDLIGANVTPELINEEIPRVITEALIYDDRIESVSNFNIQHQKDLLYISFTVVLFSGESLESEVTL